jgi:hypothetical protein
MKFINVLLAVFFLVISTIFLESFKEKKMYPQKSTESQISDNFIVQTGKKLGQKYDMIQNCIGGGVDNGIWLMSFGFKRYNSYLTEEDARKLIIECVNDCLEAVNQDEKLRPFLKVFPFTAKNLDFTIFNYDKQGNDIDHPLIKTVSNSEGKICYYTIDASKPIQPYKSKKYETYEEAVAILQKEAHE